MSFFIKIIKTYKIYDWLQNTSEGGIYMNQPPEMISTKDSGSFNERLNYIYVLSKRIKEYQQTVEDSDIKMTLERVNSMLKAHYNELLGCLNG